MTYRRRAFPVRFLIYVVVIIAMLMGILLALNYCTGGACIQRIDKTLPDNLAAPYEVSTPTHIYYTKEVDDDGETVTMSVWWEKADGKWVKNSGDLLLSRSYYGRIDVRRR